MLFETMKSKFFVFYINCPEETYFLVVQFPRIVVFFPNMQVLVISHVLLFVTPWTVAHQALPWNSPGKKTGVGCHFLLPQVCKMVPILN